MALAAIRQPAKCIVVMNSGDMSDVLSLVAMGYQHCIQRKRKDFSAELLASALMVLRPQAFDTNPIPFFFTGFSPAKDASPTDTHMRMELSKSAEKDGAITKLEGFLRQNTKLSAISELCVQAADELISNALFSAPVRFDGSRLYQEVDRTQNVTLPPEKQASFFCCYSDYRVIVGCEDKYGSVNKHLLLDHLEMVFEKDKVRVRNNSAGAGLGLRYIIENSANFYLYGEKNKRALFACGFVLEGQKANLSPEKHFHLSFE